MGDILLGYNERRLVLIPRSGSHSLVVAWMKQEEPENFDRWESERRRCHPAAYLNHQENSVSVSDCELGVVIRNPVERFRSMVAHRRLEIEEQLQSPMYLPLPHLSYTRLFCFKNQLQECANWLGITAPLPHLDATKPDDKPILTPEQEARVREIYAADIALWESLQLIVLNN